MNWINLRVSDLRAPEFLGADPLARATWLAVLAFCTDQENGGRIVGGARWTDRQWQAICGVTLAEIAQAAPLLTFDGDDVLVWNYPIEKELEVRAKREQARAAALRRWSNDDSSAPCGRNASRIQPRNAEVEVEREGKSVERGRATQAQTPPPTHRPDFEFSRATASPCAERKAETDEEWLARLRVEWPRLNIPAEIEAAKIKYPTGFDRPWFEKKWLPQGKPLIAAAPRAAYASSVKPSCLPEPHGWQAEIEDTNYAPDGAFPARSWAELPPDVQKLVTERLCVRPAAHA